MSLTGLRPRTRMSKAAPSGERKAPPASGDDCIGIEPAMRSANRRSLGIDIYKVGMVWPLARHDALEFVREKREILVIEEKRGIIESQFKEYFYDYPGHKPEHMAGKSDENNEPLVPWVG